MNKSFFFNFKMSAVVAAGLILGASRPLRAATKTQNPTPALEAPPEPVLPVDVSTAPVAAAPEKPELPADLVQVLADLDAGNARAADARSAQYVAKNKKSAAGWTLWGRAKLARGQYKAAVKKLTKALKYDSASSDAFFWKGKAYEAWGKLDEAENEYQAAFRADPQNAEAQDAFRKIDAVVGK